MKNASTSLLCLALIALVGCQQPRDRRYMNGSNLSTDPLATRDFSNNQQIPIPTPSATSTSSSSTPSVPEDIKHCQWSQDGVNNFESFANHLGAHTICQGKTVKTDVYIQAQTAVTDASVCVIPTYTDGTKSIYIGRPKCLYLQNPKTIYKVPLEANRDGFSSFPINSVMVMKDKTYFFPTPFNQNAKNVDAYLYCANYLDKYGDARFCQAYKQVGEYVFKKF